MAVINNTFIPLSFIIVVVDVIVAAAVVDVVVVFVVVIFVVIVDVFNTLNWIQCVENNLTNELGRRFIFAFRSEMQFVAPQGLVPCHLSNSMHLDSKKCNSK